MPAIRRPRPPGLPAAANESLLTMCPANPSTGRIEAPPVERCSDSRVEVPHSPHMGVPHAGAEGMERDSFKHSTVHHTSHRGTRARPALWAGAVAGLVTVVAAIGVVA